MDTTRISFGEMVAAISGAVLLIVLFFPWYGAEVSVSTFNVSASDSFSAWDAFGFIDILLFIVAISAIALSLTRAMGQSVNVGQPTGLIVAAAGAFAVLLILYRLIDTPGDFDVNVTGVEVDVTRKIGIFLGLLAAAGIAAGGWLTMNESPATAEPGGFGGPSAPGTGPGAGPVAGPGAGVGTPPPSAPAAAEPPPPGAPGGPAPPPPPPGGP